MQATGVSRRKADTANHAVVRLCGAPRDVDGELIGEVAFLDGGEASASVVAAEDIEAVSFTQARVAALLDDDPALAVAFYRSLGALAARRLRATTRSL